MEKEKTSSIQSFFKKCGFPQFLFMRLIAVYFLLSNITIFYAATKHISSLKRWTEFIRLFSFPVLLFSFVALFVLATVLFYLMPKRFRKFTECFDPGLLLGSVLVFSCALVFRSDDFYLSIVVGLFSVIMVVYGASRMHPEQIGEKRKDWIGIVPVIAVSLGVLVFVCLTSVAIHKCFETYTFDMGIFNQMYYSMSKNLSAVTTCERGVAMSHFQVHGSFILYLLLPVYAVFPSAETLIISQAVLVISGTIPTYLIAKKRGFNGLSRFAACMIYLFFLGLLAPCYFHFHENAFLPPLLMWLFYAVEYKKNVLFYIMSALVCMVKEDGPIFVICICLYLAFEERGKDRRRDLITGGAAVVYFLSLVFLLTKSGDGGMMTNRMLNMLMTSENQSVIAVLGNVLTNPGHALTVFLHQKEWFLMLLEMFFPVLFMPFFTRKTHRFFLMVPFILLNLMFGTAYLYASQIEYHYAFGTAALLIYMALINIGEMEEKRKHVTVLACACVSVISAFAMVSGKIGNYEKYLKDEAKYKNIEACLQLIPQEASVTSTANYVPHIARRAEIYSLGDDNYVMTGSRLINLKDVEKTEYFVLNPENDREAQACEILKSKGYTVFAESEGAVTILVLADA